MSQLPQGKQRYKVIGSIKPSHDGLGLAMSPRCQMMLKKLGYEDEKIIFSRRVQKCDTGKAKANPKWSTRILMLTNKALYNLRGEHTCRRRTPLESIAALTLSTKSNQLVIHVPTKYDYLYNTYWANLAAKLIKDAFEELGQEKGTEIQLPMRRVMHPNLRNFVITRKERKELTTEENLKNFNDLRRFSDTQEATGEKPLQIVGNTDDCSGVSFLERCRGWMPAKRTTRFQRSESLRIVNNSSKAIPVSERRSLKKLTRSSTKRPRTCNESEKRISVSEPLPPSFMAASPPMKELWDIRPSKHRPMKRNTAKSNVISGTGTPQMLGVHKDQLHPMRNNPAKKVSGSSTSVPFNRGNDDGLLDIGEVLAEVSENKEEENAIKTEYVDIEKDNSFKAYQIYQKSVQSSLSEVSERNQATSPSTIETLSSSDVSDSDSYTEELDIIELKEHADTDRAFRITSQDKWSSRNISKLRKEMLEQLTKIKKPYDDVSKLKKS